MNKSDLDSYVSELCSKIASKSDRKAAKEELYDHLMSHYEECISKGHSEEEAVETAVNSLGDKLDIKYQIAESYNRKHIGYKIAKAMLVAFLAFIGLIVCLIIAVVVPSFQTSSNVNKYEKLLAYIDAYDSREYNYTDVDKKIPIFPENIKNKDEVVKFKYVYFNPWDANYFWYLIMDYNDKDYNSEFTRLSNFKSVGLNKYYYSVKGAKNGYSILAVYAENGTLIYALSDSQNKNRIIYVGFNFCNGFTDINYRKYIKNEYLLEGFDGKVEYRPNIFIRKSAPEIAIQYEYLIFPSYTWTYYDLDESKYITETYKRDADIVCIKADDSDSLGRCIFFSSGFRPSDSKKVSFFQIDENGNVIREIDTASDYLKITDEESFYKIEIEWETEYYFGSAEYVFKVVM